MLDKWFKKEKPMFTMLGMGGGNANRALAGGLGPFQASGGTKSGPTGGYFYHVFDSGSTTPFSVDDGEGTIEVLLIGAGGGGGSGAGGDGGSGGGGGACGVFSAPASKGVYPVSVAPSTEYPGGNPGLGSGNGRSGPPSQLGPPTAYIRAGGGGPGGERRGPAGSGGTNSFNWSGATLDSDYAGNNGTQPPNSNPISQRNGSPGGSVGGGPQSPTLWWRPYMNGTQGSGNGGTGQGAGTPGSTGKDYGGGGGGGGGNPGGPSQASHSGGGRIVIRYPDAI